MLDVMYIIIIVYLLANSVGRVNCDPPTFLGVTDLT